MRCFTKFTVEMAQTCLSCLITDNKTEYNFITYLWVTVIFPVDRVSTSKRQPCVQNCVKQY